MSQSQEESPASSSQDTQETTCTAAPTPSIDIEDIRALDKRMVTQSMTLGDLAHWSMALCGTMHRFQKQAALIEKRYMESAELLDATMETAMRDGTPQAAQEIAVEFCTRRKMRDRDARMERIQTSAKRVRHPENPGAGVRPPIQAWPKLLREASERIVFEEPLPVIGATAIAAADAATAAD